MNGIVGRQNSALGQELMKARQHTYRRATRLQIGQLLATVLAPLILAVIGLLHETARPFIAAVSFGVTILDLALLDRLQRNRLRLAARLSEQFDCDVLAMPWNRFIAGRPADPETLAEAATAWAGPQSEIRDWYPIGIEAAPMHLARLICQRTNLWYDSTLRRRWSGAVLALAFACVVVLVVAGFVADLSLLDFSVTILAPATPLLTWAFREHYRQRDAADAIETIKSEAESLWDKANGGTVTPDACLIRSREFQNAIFARRTLNPLIFPLVYAVLRDRMEAQMNKGAERYLAEIGIVEPTMPSPTAPKP